MSGGGQQQPTGTGGYDPMMGGQKPPGGTNPYTNMGMAGGNVGSDGSGGGIQLGMGGYQPQMMGGQQSQQNQPWNPYTYNSYGYNQAPYAYTPNNFMSPMIQGSQSLMNMFQQNPSQIWSAFSPPALQQMSSFFPKNMPANPLGGSPPPAEGAPPGTQPVPGSPGSPGTGELPPEAPPQQPPPQQPQQPPQQSGGLDVPGFGNLQPWQVDQMIATKTLPPQVEQAMANLLNDDPNRVNNPWMQQYYKWTSRD